MVFNRPEKTSIVWEEIRKARPKRIYVSSDAPRVSQPDDISKVKKVREIVKNVDWECQAEYLFHENNLGCSLAGKTAFDWVFAKEDRMIELEDDTVPSQSFFTFMDEMLERYKDNVKIGYVTGQNFSQIKYGSASYFFSHYSGSSGWGTWKRVYEQWDFKLACLNEFVYNKDFKKKFDSKFEYKFWLIKFLNYYKNGGSTYDLQSIFLIFKNDLLNIIPNVNLITNIGFDCQGTNFNGGREKFGNKICYELNEIKHPDFICRNKSTDKRFFNYHFLGRSRFYYQLRWKLGPMYRFVFKKF